MSTNDIDDYVAGYDEPARSTLGALRRSILAVVPDAEQGLSYGVPAFRVGGRVVAGFSVARHHVSYLPHSGSVLASLGDELRGYEHSKGALRFPADRPLPDDLVRALVTARLAELDIR